MTPKSKRHKTKKYEQYYGKEVKKRDV